MCTATAASPSAAPETARPSEEFITLAEGSRISGLHEVTLTRMRLAGDIRFKTRGRRTPFAAEDVRRAAG